MFLGLGGGRDRDQNFGTCWDLLEFGFKFYFITSIVLCILTYLMGGVFYYFPIIVSEVVLKFQVWRLITSFMLPGMGSFAIINVLFDFYILYMFLPDIVICDRFRKKNCQLPTFCWKSFCRHLLAILFWLSSASLYCILELERKCLMSDTECFLQFSYSFGAKYL